MLTWLLLATALAGDLVLPTLSQPVVAPYPPEELAAGTEASVLLQLTVDAVS